MLLTKGATVYVAGRNKEESETAIAEIKRSTGKTACHFIQLDLGDLKSVKAGAESFLKQAGRLDALILNAGVMAPPPHLKTTDGCAWTRAVSTLICRRRPPVRHQRPRTSLPRRVRPSRPRLG